MMPGSYTHNSGHMADKSLLRETVVETGSRLEVTKNKTASNLVIAEVAQMLERVFQWASLEMYSLLACETLLESL